MSKKSENDLYRFFRDREIKVSSNVNRPRTLNMSHQP